MKNLLYLLMVLPFAVKAQKDKAYMNLLSGETFYTQGSIGYPSTPLIIAISNNKRIYNVYDVSNWESYDTVKVVMLVSDTSTVKNNPGYQDTRPFMMYGFQTSSGELLDAYKQKLNKNIVMWIAYKTN